MGRGETRNPQDWSLAVAAVIRDLAAAAGRPISALDGVIGSHGYTHDRLSAQPTRGLSVDDVAALAVELAADPAAVFQQAAALIQTSRSH